MSRLIAIVLSAAVAWGLAGPASAQQCETPNMMIVLDKSGSMGNDNKWTQARNAIDYILDNYGDILRFGLDMFPSNDLCGAGNVQVDVGNNTASTIMNTLNATSPNGNTPMAATLMVLNQYRPLKDQSRRNFVMLVSDGADTCAADTDNDPVRAAEDLYANGIRTFVIGFGSGAVPSVLNAIAAAGHTGSYYQADDQASLQAAMDSIVNEALVEICDNRDNDCDGAIDEDFPDKGTPCQIEVGGCIGHGVWVCNAAGDGLECDAQVNSSDEVCDGFDNDCDGLTDEDFPDVDGDGYTNCSDCCDSGNEAMDGCNAGTMASIHPGATEVCNGYDDDCDGAIDEDDPQLEQPCGDSDEGECAFGLLLCVGGELTCVGEVGPVDEVNCEGVDNDFDCASDGVLGHEICGDGLDNDCDGDVDMWDDDCGGGCVPGQQRPCGNDEGDCVAGVQTCDADGQWGPCEGGYAGGEEVCDGRDNDCDGDTDEDDVCGSGSDCEPGETEPCGIDQGECQSGVRTCTAEGYWSDCAGAVEPLPEWCNGLDDDCDGMTDEGDLCEGYELCLCGHCAPPCSAGECPSGNLTCVGGWCVVDPCCGIHCQPGLECDLGGDCVDPCETEQVECPDGQVCRMGVCVDADCYTPGHECEAGMVCAAGQCVADPCYNVDCPDGQYCRAGSCQDLDCADCGPSQECIGGQCVDSPCAGVTCPPGQACVGGQCTADPCQGVYCAQGEICIDGSCLADPCAAIDCPEQSRCEDGYCVPAEDQPTDGGVDAGPDGAADGESDGETDGGSDPGPDGGGQDAGVDGGSGSDQDDGGGGGCGCASRDARSGGLALLALLLGLAWRRRS